jgi:predicted O-methyltransferase YrrM
MSKQTMGLDPSLYRYFLAVTLEEPDILRRLREETATHPLSQMQIAPEQGQFMRFLVQLIGAKKTLEIGVFTGYSALVVALALPPEGRVVACDLDEEFTAIARRYWQQAGVGDKIDLRLAPALETLSQLLSQGEANSFDFAFIDADKSNYDAYYEKALQLVRPGGLIAIDNVLWGGKVADPAVQDSRTQAIRDLNQKIHQDPRVLSVMVPIADGLTLAIKQGDR